MNEAGKGTVSCRVDSNKLSLRHSELAKSEEILVDYKRYKELLFKLSPPEWQEAQRAKASGARVLSVEDTRGEQKKQPVESAISNKGEYFTLVQDSV